VALSSSLILTSVADDNRILVLDSSNQIWQLKSNVAVLAVCKDAIG
jgi:hypothetical protein